MECDVEITLNAEQDRIMALINYVRAHAQVQKTSKPKERWDLLDNVTDIQLYPELVKVMTGKGAVDKIWKQFCRPAWVLDNKWRQEWNANHHGGAMGWYFVVGIRPGSWLCLSPGDTNEVKNDLSYALGYLQYYYSPNFIRTFVPPQILLPGEVSFKNLATVLGNNPF